MKDRSKNGLGQLVIALALTAGFTFADDHIDLTRYTIDGGGAVRSSGGEFELSGTIGQPHASNPLVGQNFSLIGGFWGGVSHSQIGDYSTWAAANIALGLDDSFDGDANHDGLANGVVYVFGNTGIQPFGQGGLTAPPSIVPRDINLLLESSGDLVTWTPILEYTAGIQTLSDPDLTIENGIVLDSGAGVKGYYRYRVELTP